MDDMARTQTFANHRRIPPLPYAIAALVLIAEVVHRVVVLIQEPSLAAAWSSVVAMALLVIASYARTNAQVVQDRIIRDGMVLRLRTLLPAGRHGDIARLTLPQLVALRFASDAELPTLVGEVIAGRLVKPDAIKRAITAWQADWLRV